MNKTSMIIRLIDVVLILLFGFIKISHIVFFAQIKLPASEQDVSTEEDEKDKEIVVVLVDSKLQKEGSEEVIMKFVIPEAEKDSREYNNLNELEDYLVARANDNKKLNNSFLVLIEPFPESLLQTAVDVMDICKRNNIEQSIKSPVSWSQ